jgi:septation ring formation regulator
MNKFLSYLSDSKVVIAIIIIVVVLTIWLIVTRINTKRYRTDLEKLETKYNEIKKVPLSFKMNKAVAISRVDQETMDKVEKAKTEFSKTETDMSAISEHLAEAEDFIIAGKLRKADGLINSLEQDITDAHREVKSLDILLDDILAKETAQRQEVTTLKNRFRALKSQAQENASRLSFNWSTVEQKINDTEKMFTTFEEWMFSSDFDKANAELETIRTSMSELEKMVDTMPGLLEDARGVIPSMAETLHHDYQHHKNRGVYLKHLEIEKNLAALSASLKEDLIKLKAGRQDGVGEHLDDYKMRLTQMDEAVKKEGTAYDEMRALTKETETLANEVNQTESYLRANADSSANQFGLHEMEEVLQKNAALLDHLNASRPETMAQAKSYAVPASEVVISLKQLLQGYTDINEELKQQRAQMDAANNDVDRAKKQLVKLQIIMNSMQVKIRRYKLPNISTTYQDDMDKANTYIHHLEGLLKETPISIQLLNSTLQEALDFIYKLYNNVNNVVGTVVMVENTIVFGNRYRSTYEDIDSELTRSELCFRNGEYTQALQIAISTMEKIHPGNYESIVRENAKSAA